MSDETKPAAQPPVPEAPKKAPEAEPQLLATSSPHIRAPEDVQRIMWTVVIALLPALFMGCYFFGWAAARTDIIAVAVAVFTEAIIQRLTGRKVTVSDGSAVVTGLLVAFVTPSNAPWFVPAVGSAFAIAIAKQAFGGLGCNIWNPALAGRAFAVACFASMMVGGWGKNWVDISRVPHLRVGYTRADAVTGASPLSAQKDYLRSLPGTSDRAELEERLGRTPRETLLRVQERNNTPLIDLVFGGRVGCVGETSAIAILIGGLILLATGVIRWHIPVAFIGSVALFGWLLPLKVPAYDPALAAEPFFRWVWCGGDPLFQILTGGVMLGAFFMATDMVTSPISRRGQLLFGAGCGLITIIIRKYGGYPEGVCYSILLMNTVVPLIDRFTRPRVYGKKR